MLSVWKSVGWILTATLLSCSSENKETTSAQASGGSTAAANPAGGGVADKGTDGNSLAGAASVDPTQPFIDIAGLPPTTPSFRRGINLGNRLDAPNEGDWGPAISKSDFPLIAARGFDHVRLPVRFFAHAASQAPYTIDPPFLERVDWVIEQALTNGLSLILDFHSYEELMSDPARHRERFLGIWANIAQRYRNLPNTLILELLNEPQGVLSSSWNELAAAGVAQIRQSNPDRAIVIDSADTASAKGLAGLVLPNDPHLITTAHFYEPRPFTLQGASSPGPAFATTGIVFPGPPQQAIWPVAAALDIEWMKTWFSDYNQLPSDQNPSGPKTIDEQVGALAAFRLRTDCEVYLGEFATTKYVDQASRVNFVTMMRERSEQAGIGWAIWDDNGGDMSIYSSADGTWNEAIVNALIPR
jgi:endoglucanase